MTRISRWLRLASHPLVLKRSAMMCVLVGTILVGINHGPAIIAGAIHPTLVVQVILTYLVPFLVSTASSVATLEGNGAANAADQT